MKVVNYLRDKGIRRAFQVLWRYKVDIIIQKIFTHIYNEKTFLDVIVIESHNDFDSNGGAFYEFLINNGYNKKYRIVWLIRNVRPANLPENVICFNIYKPSLKKNYYLVNAKYIMTCQDAIGSFRKGQISCYLTHGAMALKNTKGNIFIPESMTYILSPSETLLPIQADLLSIKYPNRRQVILGYPCHDVIYNLEHGDLCKITKKKYKKVILWMPTFRYSKMGERNDSNYEYSMGIPIIEKITEYEEINELLKQLNMLLIIKIHPMQDLSKIKINSMSNIIVLDGECVKQMDIDNYRLMVDVDAMITDYSSSGTDFLHTGKPIAYTVDDVNLYKLGFIVDNIEDFMPGPKIKFIGELISYFEKISVGEDAYKDMRKDVLDKMFSYQDGNSCKRLSDFIGLEKGK